MAVVSSVPAIAQPTERIRYPDISAYMARSGEIVEEPVAVVRIIEDMIYVAVGKDVKDSKSTLVWAVHNSGGKKICILHVHQPAQMIPLMGTRFPASSLKDQEVRAYREIERQHMNKILDDYLCICRQMGIRAEKIHTEMDCIEKGIVKLISQLGIRKLVMGAAADKHHSRKMMDLRSKKAIYVCQQAPVSCHIQFICKGHLIHTREGNSDGLDTEVPLLRPSPNTDIEQSPHHFRSQSVTIKRNNRPKLTNPAQDLFRRVRSINLGNGSSTTDVTYTDGTDGFSTPRSSYEPGASPVEWDQVSSRSVSGYSTGSSAGLGDLALIQYEKAEGSENGSSDSRSLSHFKDLNHSSPPSVLDGNVDDTLYDHLEQAMSEAENAKRDAFHEGIRRGKAEKECDLPLDILMHFISTFPWEFTDFGGSLRVKLQEWLMGCSKKNCNGNCCSTETKLLKGLHEFPSSFTVHYSVDSSITFDDEDLESWEFEAKRWARVLFLTCQEEYQLIPTLMFIQTHALDLCQENKNLDQIPVKFLIVTLSLVRELQMMQDRVAEYRSTIRTKSESRALELMDQFGHPDALNLYQKFTNVFILILKELVSLANLSCSIFSHANTTKMADASLPGSVKGKLGGPSQRRLSSSTTTAVLQAIISMKALATISSWCAQFIADASLDLAFNFMWEFYWKTVSSSVTDSETGAEISLAAYEALAPALTALVSMFSPKSLDLVKNNGNLFLSDGKPLLDSLVLSFLQNINNLLAIGVFVRTRRAVLMNWKWICLESLLSIPCYALKKGLHLEDNNFLLSGDTLRLIFTDLLESLENAGENSVLPMLRSVRLVLGLLSEGKSGSLVYSCDGVDAQMMWHLVQSSWILHVSCNKRKVAPIAALLSSVLHSSLFSDESMHMNDNAPGPLKWFVEKILEEGTKSPRTIRLAALHLTGLFLSYPRIIKYYVKELKLLSLHGSVAFDEDFEGELADNHDTRTEVSLLAKGPDPELTKEFINTELYARASVAVLFYKLADLSDMVGSPNENEDCHAALESGKMFLLELLDSAVNDKDLSKELYKKYSAIHRRKVRAWQMICILSRFICQDIVSEVSRCLHICLYMNNLPAVRQYLETFAINMYLKFPSLVGQQLVPVLRDYEMRPQALSSYVFIAANVILHASQAVQDKHLNELLPPIFPLLTSHHHSLRGFAQLLVYQVLCKLFPPLDSRASGTMTLEKRCFEDLKSYLAKNSDCVRLRASMGGFLDAYSPSSSVTPAGIFINRVEALEFECVPVSLTEQVLNFLNDVREDLRSSMAKDAAAIKNESLRSDEDQNCTAIPSNANEGNSHTQQPKDISLDFQKKITLSKHEKHDIAVNSFFGNQDTYKPLEEMEKEDKLLAQVLQSRSQAMERERASRQQLILVASLLDRIPNLAGLARTCEVFKASGLAVADANVVHDKQFQLISVTAEKWVPIIEVPVDSLKVFLERKKRECFSILGLEQTANSVPLDQYSFPKKTVLVLGREKEGIPVEIIHILDACIEIPQLGVVRSLNVHVSGAIALWEYTRQQRSSQ